VERGVGQDNAKSNETCLWATRFTHGLTEGKAGALLTQEPFMKKILTAMVAGSLAAGLGAGAAVAQNSTTGSTNVDADQTANIRAVLQDARLEGMKAALKITPDQEKYWTPFEKALRDSFALRGKIMGTTGMAITKDDPVQLLDKVADDVSQSAAQTKKVAEAARPLYDSLSPEQKRSFGPLLLTLRVNPMAAARRAERVREQLMQRWTQSDGNDE
jgi:hypothetical protein